MGLLDGLLGSLGPMLGGAGRSGDLVHGVLNMLDDPRHGGIAGLVQSFQQNGMGDVIHSWIGTGPNQTITPDRLMAALGPERMQAISQATGITPESLGTQLSTVLPTLIDKLTPTGALPQGSILDHAMNLLKSQLG